MIVCNKVKYILAFLPSKMNTWNKAVLAFLVANERHHIISVHEITLYI